MRKQGFNPTALFITGTVLGALSCFSRADYNLPMFAFLAVMWNQDDVSSDLDLNSLRFTYLERENENQILAYTHNHRGCFLATFLDPLL